MPHQDHDPNPRSLVPVCLIESNKNLCVKKGISKLSGQWTVKWGRPRGAPAQPPERATDAGTGHDAAVHAWKGQEASAQSAASQEWGPQSLEPTEPRNRILGLAVAIPLNRLAVRCQSRTCSHQPCLLTSRAGSCFPGCPKQLGLLHSNREQTLPLCVRSVLLWACTQQYGGRVFP